MYSGNAQPHPLPYGCGSDWTRRLTSTQKSNTTAAMGVGDMAGDCFLAASEVILVGLGAAVGQDARAPRIADHSYGKHLHFSWVSVP